MARGFLAILLLLVAGFGLADDKQSLDSVRAMKLAAPKKWAVVIGASDYKELGSLKYARNDAVEFAHALTEDFSFRPEDVTLLIDKDRPEAAPTAKNVLASLDRIFADKRLDKGDLFIFYFSGHGVGTKAGDFLCPTDTTRSTIEKVGLPVREVIKRIVGAGLKNVLILCDACRAEEQNPFGGELQELAGKANLAVLLGCAPGKRSYEYAELSHGAFTHFLLQGMRDPALRDSVSGAVWASRLAEFVKKQVHDYTEPDHGKFAQQPASWNEQTQDVLLASFAPRIEAVQQAMADLAGSKRINNAVYGTALYSIAELLATKRLTGPAIELLKTIDQLGEMTSRRKMTLAGLLLEAHRYSEAARFCDQVIGEDRGYYRDQAILISPSPAITAAQRAKAAEAIWAEDKDFASGLTALTSATSRDDRRRLLGRLVRTFSEGNAEGLYLQALAAREAHDRVKEFDRLWASTKAKGEDLAIHAALEDLMLLYQAAKDIAGELKVISAAIDTGKDKLMWLGQLASVYRELKQPDKMIASIHRGLRSGETMDPLQVLSMVDTAGLRAAELVDDLKTVVDQNPSAWELQTALWLAQTAGKLDPNFQFSPEMKRYAPDPIELRLTAFATLKSMVDESKPDSTTKLLFDTKFFISLLPYQKDFLPDNFLWDQMLAWAEGSRSILQLGRIAEARLYPLVYSGKAPEDVSATAMSIAMDTGDDRAVDRIWKAIAANGGRQTDEVWRYVVYLLARGRAQEAEAMLGEMPKPGRTLGPRLPAICRAYADALLGRDKAKVQAALDANRPGDEDQVEAMLIWALADGAIGRRETASKVFYNLLLSDDESWLHLRAAGLRWMWQDARENGKAEDVLALASLADRFFGNPLFGDVAYMPGAKIADYAGSVVLDAMFMGVGGSKHNGSGKLTITIRADGTAEGKMDGLSFAGKIDAGGDLVATGTWDGEKIWLRTKMAPPAIYKSYADKGSQPAIVLDENFERTLMDLKASG